LKGFYRFFGVASIRSSLGAVFFSAVFAVAALSAVTARGVAVERWIWGFDGKAVKDRFTPLSVLVSNPSAEAFDGVIVLRKQGPMGAGNVGAPIYKRVFLGPFSSKWIQFEPFVRGDDAKWRLRWGKRMKDSAVVPAPSLGGAAAVRLMRGSAVFARSKIQAPPFQENLFPPSVAATSGLAAIALDHTPEFTPAQTTAFLDWLHAGGRLYILPDASGTPPTFSGELSVLNFPGRSMKIGAGMVEKRSISDKLLAAKEIGAAAKIEHDDNSTIYIDNITDTFFHYVRKRVKTNHNWGLIFFISVVYMLMVTVVNFLAGRKAKSPFKPIAFFVITVAVFSFLLAWCGKRGQGEKSQINSLTIAREAAPGRFVVEQWLDVFATSGADYTIQDANGEPSFFSDCREEGALNAEIVNGTGAFIRADIPMFSSVQFLRAGVASAPNAAVKSFKQAFDGANARFMILELDADFPAPIIKVAAVAHGRFYAFRQTADNKYEALVPADPETFSKRIERWYNGGGSGAIRFGAFDDEEEEQSIESLFIPMIIRTRGGDKSISSYSSAFFPTAAASDDQTDIYILAETPDSFKCENDSIKLKKGYVMFHFIRR